MSQATTNILPVCDSTLRRSSDKPMTNVYAAFKVLQIVRAFRKRVKTQSRPTKAAAPKRVAYDFCQQYEAEAYAEIDRWLGRKSCHRNRPYKLLPKVVNANDTDKSNQASAAVLVDKLNEAINAKPQSITTIASNNKLFFQRKEDLTFRKAYLHLTKLTETLVVIKDLLRTLDKSLPHHHSGHASYRNRELLDIELDDTYTANLRHLLLCLKHQLIAQLVSRLIELVYKHVVDCQKDQCRQSDQWFFEFPDARHPLNTTWPWTDIRPALVILWGVCWMFYDYYNESSQSSNTPQLTLEEGKGLVDERGHIFLDWATCIQVLSDPQRQQHNYSLQIPMPRLRAMRTDQPSHSLMPENLNNQNMSAAPQYTPDFPPSVTFNQSARSGYQSSVAQTFVQGTNPVEAAPRTTYDAAPHILANGDWPPEAHNFPTGYNSQANAYTYRSADVESWCPEQATFPGQQQQSTGFAYGLAGPPPPVAPRALTPNIRLTTDITSSPVIPLHPEDTGVSATSASSHSSYLLPLYPQASYFSAQQYPGGSLLDPRQQQYMSVLPQDGSTTQTSTLTPEYAAPPDTDSKRQPYSDIDEVPRHAGTSRSGSVAPNVGEHGDEGYSPQQAAIKRDEAPMNGDGKYVCTHTAECSALTFDRKCEWSKHMDKHVRPYHCPHPSCAKLQGFTYSGGLLRHEREVHGKHGGPKAQLMCPYPDCKRYNGKGFTRRENLNEHIRRLHQDKDPSQLQQTRSKRDAAEAFSGAEEGETPVSEDLLRDEQVSPELKRRRYVQGHDEAGAGEEVNFLRSEIGRLHSVIEDRDSQLANMQKDMLGLQEAVRQLQQQGTV